MVGFNRRYSPFAAKLSREFADRTTPLVRNYRVNAGMLPDNHGILMAEGGGRLRGEACHMVDLFRFLVSKPLLHCDIEALPPVASLRSDENFVARFRYEDGSLCSLTYVTTGGKELRKEWAECHWDGKSAVLDDYISLSFHGCAGSQILPRQDKGHANALETFLSAIEKGKAFPIPWEQLSEITRTTIELDHEAWGRLSAGTRESNGE